MHNNIMAAGSKERPPMLGPGRYSQWRSRFLRYIDTKPNGEGLRKSILSGPYVPSTILVQAVAATKGVPAVQQHTTIETVLNMTGNLKLLCNFVEKFLGTVLFGNDQFALILGYGDLNQGYVTIKREIYFFVRDLQGNNLLTGNRGSDLYTISLHETTSSTPIYFMAKASPTQAWLWHRRLSHLNFDYITLLSKKDIVTGLPKLIYVKDQLCASNQTQKEKEIAKPVTPQSESVSEKDTDWLENRDEEIDKQELEAHYSFMAKIQEVLPEEPSSTEQLLEQIPYDYSVLLTDLPSNRDETVALANESRSN
ncbi:retrovirus-related pol polyprotein from transposon TNT 1-94 [Tanacetum coccineum]